ncbi:MAG: diphthine synthase [Candidatus Altiarchaeales archaeon]|nr:diphthine synthase [Candidatus Altiarchaeales archaeon]
MLYLVGLGLFDEKDISLRGLGILKKSDRVYAEFYTNFSHASLKKLESLAGKKIVVLTRKDIEERPEENVLKDAGRKVISLLVSGDPMVATTHIDLVLRARKKGIKVKIIHASSVYSAVAETGLQIYKFGRTTSIVYPEKNYFPESPYDAIKENKKAGLHTLCLLDVKADEQRYMTVNEGIDVLLQIEAKRKQKVFTQETFCIGVARLGGDSVIMAGKAKELLKTAFGKPPQILIIPGKMHFMEEEALKTLSD